MPLNHGFDEKLLGKITALPWSKSFGEFYPANSVVSDERKKNDQLLRPGLPKKGDFAILCCKNDMNKMEIRLAEIFSQSDRCDVFWTCFRKKSKNLQENWFSCSFIEHPEFILSSKQISPFYKTFTFHELQKDSLITMFNSSLVIESKNAKEYLFQCVKEGLFVRLSGTEEPEVETTTNSSTPSPSNDFGFSDDDAILQSYVNSLNDSPSPPNFLENQYAFEFEPVMTETEDLASLLNTINNQITKYANKRKRRSEEEFEAEKKQKLDALQVQMAKTWDEFLVESRKRADEMEMQVNNKCQLLALEMQQKHSDLITENSQLAEQNLKLRQEMRLLECQLEAKRKEVAEETEALSSLKTKVIEQQQSAKNHLEQTKIQFEHVFEQKKSELQEMLSNSIQNLFRSDFLQTVSEDKVIV